MKLFYILNLLIFILVFTACKKDNNTRSIVGKWYWVEQTYNSYTNNVLTRHDVYDTKTLDPNSYFEYAADGTFIEKPQNTSNFLYKGKYHIIGDTLYSKRDVDDQEEHYFIKTLNQSTLVIKLTTGQEPYRGEREYKMKR
jgi:hypothetical protein